MATNKRKPKVQAKNTSSLFLDDFPTSEENTKEEVELKDLDLDSLYKIQIIKSKLIIDSTKNEYSMNNIFELAESIAKFVLISPINIRDNGDGTYELISGHRRRKAFDLIFSIYRAIDNNDDQELARIKNINNSYGHESTYWKIVDLVRNDMNRFSEFNCIPAIIFPQNMTDEEIVGILNEANVQNRTLQIEDAMKQFDYYISQIEIVNPTQKEITKFIFDKFNNLGYEWKESKILGYVAIVTNGSDLLKQMFLNKEISYKNARFISTFDAITQEEILVKYNEDPITLEEYKLRKKQKALNNKLTGAGGHKQAKTAVKPKIVVKSLTELNNSIHKLKQFNIPLTRITKKQTEEITEVIKQLKITRAEVYDTLSSLEILLEKSKEI